MWRGLGAVFTGLDGGIDAGEVGKRRCGQFSGECALGVRPGVVDGTGLVPVAGPVAQYAVVERGGAFGSFDDVAKGDVRGRSGQRVAPGGSLLSDEEPFGYESSEGQGEGLVGDLLLGGDFASLAVSGLAVAGNVDHGPNGVVAGALEFELHGNTILREHVNPKRTSSILSHYLYS